jgi:hypothetical protein
MMYYLQYDKIGLTPFCFSGSELWTPLVNMEHYAYWENNFCAVQNIFAYKNKECKKYLTSITFNSKRFWRWYVTLRTNWFLDFVHRPEIENRDVSEAGSASVLRWRVRETPTQLGPLDRANLNHLAVLVRERHLRRTFL